MAYKITDKCIACGTCIDECPVGAISEGSIYVIDADSCVGLFCEGHIYRCFTDGALIDDMETPVFISDTSGYEFEEVPFDNSDIEPIAAKLREECRCSVSVIPSVKIGSMILYSCKVTVIGFKNTGVGEAMAENKMNGLRLAYREASSIIINII